MKHMIVGLEGNALVAGKTIDRLKRALAKAQYQTIAEAFAKSAGPHFANFLKSELDPDDLGASPIHEIILRTGFRGVFTTNLDRVFEHQSTSPDPLLIYPACLNDPASFRTPRFLAKIHGCVTNAHPDQIVLTRKSFRDLVANASYKKILEAVFTIQTVLTVGYSLRDPDFATVTASLQSRFGSRWPPVFALMLKPTKSAIAKWWSKGVDIIPFEKPSELVGFFRELWELAKKKRPEPVLTLSTPPLAAAHVRDQKPQAWEFFQRWREDVRQGKSPSPAFGRVNVTLKAWRHITRTNVSQREVCHKLTLLPCAREILEKATAVRVVRKSARKSLYALRGVYSAPFQGDVLVEVIVESKEKAPTSPFKTFLSVYEKRTSAYV